MKQPNDMRPAFAGDRSAQAAGGALKALWWVAAGMATRAAARPGEAKPEGFAPSAEPSAGPSAEPYARPSPEPYAGPYAGSAAEPAPEGFLRRAWLEAFDKDAADVARGLYPPMGDGPSRPAAALAALADLMSDARQVEARRRRGGAAEARDDAPDGGAYPAYYRQNFHFQSGGWFTPQSARRYDAQVEALFAGAAGAMRRRALSLMAAAWRGRDQRGLAVLDLACGSGAFLKDLAAAFPRARLIGADLSAPYLEEARRRSGLAALVQANAERLPLADASLAGVCTIYLFHELPPKVRLTVAAEIARVLEPGGLLAFADSMQESDEPRLARLLRAFPAYFHEPYYRSYGATDFTDLFARAGLRPVSGDTAFLTKALLFEKA